MKKNHFAETAYTQGMIAANSYEPNDDDEDTQRILQEIKTQKRIDQLDNKKYRNLGVDIDI